MTPEPTTTTLQARVTVAKDITATARDAALLLLGLLLIAFPSTFNGILVSAGFEEGSIAGMKWKSKLQSSDQALKVATSKIAELRKQLAANQNILRIAQPGINDPKLAAKVEEVVEGNSAVKKSASAVESSSARVISDNAAFVAKATSALNLDSEGFAVVFGTDSTPELAQYEVDLAAQKYGIPDAKIFYRNGGYVSVSVASSLEQANATLLLAKRKRQDSYIASIKTWCPTQKIEERITRCIEP
jgi:hypothetical protein